MNCRTNYILLLLLTITAVGFGQDIHYSQMYATPLYINPAFAGNHNADYRVGVNYRQQAASFTVPFETYTAWGDTRLSPRFVGKRGWFGLGAQLYYDNAGDGDLKKIQAMVFTSYSQGFNADNSIYGSLGIGLGYTNRSINRYNLIYGDQWDSTLLAFNGSSIDPTLIKNSSIFYPDFNLGISLHQVVNDNWMYEIGGSVSHITSPVETFYGTNNSRNNRVARKYIGYGTMQLVLSKVFVLTPEVYFIYQNETNEAIFGANLVYNIADFKLYGGLWHRLERDVIPVVGMEYNKFTLLFSYDVNISKQRVASNYKGGFEVSLVKKFFARMSTKRRPCNFLLF